MSDDRERDPNWSELNDQGDYISGDVGEDGKDIVVGKNIDTRRTEQNQRNDIVFNLSNFEQQRRPAPQPLESSDEYQRRMIIELERKTAEKFENLTLSLNNLANTVATNTRVGDLTNQIMNKQLSEIQASNEETKRFVMESLKGLRVVPAPEQPTPEVKIHFPKWLIWGLIAAIVLLFLIGLGFMYYITLGGK
jgi:hypothetical protein